MSVGWPETGAGWSARREVRVGHGQVLRQLWRPLTGVFVVVVLVTAGSAVFASGPMQRGFILGSGLMGAAWVVTPLVVLSAGTAPLMMGELAEQCPGGVVLLETKWSAQPWRLDDRDTHLSAAVLQALRNAKQLAGWREVQRHGGPQVEPVLVL